MSRPTVPRNQRLKTAFADFFRALRQLWLQWIGGIFLALGLVFVFAALQEYRKYTISPEAGATRLFVSAASSAVMFFFALESFWKARKPRQ